MSLRAAFGLETLGPRPAPDPGATRDALVLPERIRHRGNHGQRVTTLIPGLASGAPFYRCLGDEAPRASFADEVLSLSHREGIPTVVLTAARWSIDLPHARRILSGAAAERELGRLAEATDMDPLRVIVPDVDQLLVSAEDKLSLVRHLGRLADLPQRNKVAFVTAPASNQSLRLVSGAGQTAVEISSGDASVSDLLDPPATGPAPAGFVVSGGSWKQRRALLDRIGRRAAADRCADRILEVEGELRSARQRDAPAIPLILDEMSPQLWRAIFGPEAATEQPWSDVQRAMGTILRAGPSRTRIVVASMAPVCPADDFAYVDLD